MSENAVERRKGGAGLNEIVLQLLQGEQLRGERHEKIIAEMQKSQATTAEIQKQTADVIGKMQDELKCQNKTLVDMQLADARRDGAAAAKAAAGSSGSGKGRVSWFDDAGTKKLIVILAFLLVIVVLGLIAGVTIWRDFSSIKIP